MKVNVGIKRVGARYQLAGCIMAFFIFTGNLFVSSQAQNVNEQSSGVTQLYNMVKAGEVLLIDVRTLGEFAQGHLEGAILIEYQDIARDIMKYTDDPDMPIALYCRSGQRSGVAQAWLQRMGFENSLNIGGYESLKMAGFPDQKP